MWKWHCGIIAFFILSCRNSSPDSGSKLITDSNSVFGNFTTDPEISLLGSGIVLHKDSSYYYSHGSCLASGYDSGRFTMRSDTLYFKSFLEKEAEKQKQERMEKTTVDGRDTVVEMMGHNMITPISGDKYLYKNGKIFIYLTDSGFYETAFWQKEGTPWRRDTAIVLSGNHTLYNKFKQITKKGEFRNNELFNGFIYQYDGKDKFLRVDTVRNGQIITGKLK